MQAIAHLSDSRPPARVKDSSIAPPESEGTPAAHLRKAGLS
jgi:hypothetical protein